jgi:DNA-binding NtrC family response regulator
VNNSAKVLIIEDEEIVRETLAENVRDKGFFVESAENAALALEMIKRSHYDILLVDYRLPDMNGLALIKEALMVSKDSIPIVVTGYSSVETAVDAMRMGAYDYLLKPVDLEALVSEINVILQERDTFRRGRERLHESVMGSLSPMNDMEAVVLASKDSLIPFGREGIFKKIISIPGTFLRRIKEFYWG